MALFVQRPRKRQRAGIGTGNGRRTARIKPRTPVENPIPETEALFSTMQYELDERMVAIALMKSFKDQMKALRDIARKKDAPPTVAPMGRGAKCTEEEFFFLSIWQKMVSLHGSSGSTRQTHGA